MSAHPDRIGAVLDDLATAYLTEDAELRTKSMERLIRLARVGSQYLDRIVGGVPPQPESALGMAEPQGPEHEPVPTLFSALRRPMPRHRRGTEFGFVGPGKMGNIDGRRVRRYFGNAYRSLARQLPDVEYRPCRELEGGFWLTTDEALKVRKEHKERYTNNTRGMR